jgi:hypothetical protein
MTTMITEVYDAFKSAGAEDQKARKAAEALSNHQDEITILKIDVSTIKSDLSVIRWIQGIGFSTVLAMLIPMFWKMFSL